MSGRIVDKILDIRADCLHAALHGRNGITTSRRTGPDTPSGAEDGMGKPCAAAAMQALEIAAEDEYFVGGEHLDPVGSNSIVIHCIRKIRKIGTGSDSTGNFQFEDTVTPQFSASPAGSHRSLPELTGKGQRRPPKRETAVLSLQGKAGARTPPCVTASDRNGPSPAPFSRGCGHCRDCRYCLRAYDAPRVWADRCPPAPAVPHAGRLHGTARPAVPAG